MAAGRRSGVRPKCFLALAALALLTLGELRVFERLLFSDPAEYGFVLESVRGVLAGTPVSKSWAHRVLAPAMVHAIEPLSAEPLAALRAFTEVAIFASNLLLFGLLRRSGVDAARSLLVCAGYGFARILITYKLEYPWDEVDVLLFLVFGYVVAGARPLVGCAALLLIGLFNHETALLFPLWFVVSPAEKPRPPAAMRELSFGLGATFAAAAAIVVTRNERYAGRPVLRGQAFEEATPVVENHLHIEHNLRELFVANWLHGRQFISISFFVVVFALVASIVRVRHVRASLWSLAFLMTVVAFGYVNETRHYLPLLAFWVIHPCARRHETARQSSVQV
jgi:hypothetical protein